MKRSTGSVAESIGDKRGRSVPTVKRPRSPTKRPRCDKGFPRATKEELRMLFANFTATCDRDGLSAASMSQAWASAKIDPDKAARCYGAIVRSYEREREERKCG